MVFKFGTKGTRKKLSRIVRVLWVIKEDESDFYGVCHEVELITRPQQAGKQTAVGQGRVEPFVRT